MSHVNPAKKTTNIEVVDLFCGVGGLTHGLVLEGLKVVAGIDFDPDCQFPYQHNNKNAKFINRDIERIKSSEVAGLYSPGTVRVLIGCAPCQPYSKYSRTARKKASDERWILLNSFAKLIRKLQPDIVSMENVPQLMDHSVFLQFMRVFEQCNYFVAKPTLAYCPDYGVPQQRTRLVIFASKYGPIEMVKPEAFSKSGATVREAIASLPPLKAGQRSRSDNLHRSSDLSDINLQRIKVSRPGGTWREWPSHLIAECHKKIKGATYPAVYGRMEWDKPAPTITTQFFGYGNGRFGHPSQNRAISLREGALLQSFPKKYLFESPDKEMSFQTVGRLIGNAVPVNLGRAIGMTIREHVEQKVTRAKGRGGK